MGIAGNNKLTGLTCLVAIVGSLFGLTITGCSDSGDSSPAVNGGKVVYEYSLRSAKTELPAGVSYITYTGYDKDGQEIFSKAKVNKAQTVTLANVPEGTTRMDAIYYDGNSKQVAFGVNTFASVSKGTETTVSTPSYVPVEKLHEAMSVVVEPSEEIIGVDDTVAYNVYRLFDNGVDQDPIKDKLAVALKSGDAAVADFAQGAEPNVITGLAFGETEVGLVDAYKFMEQAIPTTAAKLTVLDGELQSVELMPVNDKAIFSEESNVLYIVNNYLNESTENTWAKKYVEEYKNDIGKNFELQSSQMKVVAYYMVKGKKKVAEVTKRSRLRLTSQATARSPFSLVAGAKCIVSVDSTATHLDKDVLTVSFTDPLDSKTEMTDSITLAAATTDVQLMIQVESDTPSEFELAVGIPEDITDVLAQPRIITYEDGPINLCDLISVKKVAELSIIPSPEKITIKVLTLTANESIDYGEAYLKIDLDGNTNEVDGVTNFSIIAIDVP